MASTININKTQTQTSISDTHTQSDRISKMESEISAFIKILEQPNEQFDPDKAFDALHDYII